MTQRNTQRNNRGFTLMEVLLAVAILIVLMGLAMIPITRHQRDLRQTELDGKAETIYMAAQNRLAQLQANGRGEDYGKDRATAMNNIPWDAEQDKYDASSLYYVTSAAKLEEQSAAYHLLPEEQVERELWDNSWVIEYDPDSGSVYAVFYSERDIEYSFDGFNALRSRERRLKDGAKVGYYGGDSVQSEETGKLSPQMEIINKEQLLLKVTCDTPRDPLHFYVTIRDSYGHRTKRMELQLGGELNIGYRTYTALMVLDNLKDNQRFCQQSRFSTLTPGADLTITVEIESDSKLVDSVSGTLTANSLFAEVRDGSTAVIKYARHLQNLDQDSGVGSLTTPITRAVQEQDIQFVNTDEADGWDALYPGRTFTPIRNNKLVSYDSTVTVDGRNFHPVIYGLTVKTDGDGGLFQSFSNGELRNIRLCGASIASSKGKVGGLAGSMSGTVTVSGCQVYLSRSRDKLSTKTEKDIWLSGGTAGGLVGESRGTLTITESFAASVIQGSTYAGGLVGFAPGGTVSAQRCYADCYLYADGTTGGLVAGCNGTADILLKECYAAGFQEADVTAGLVGGEISGGDSINTCYSACARLDPETPLTYSTARPGAESTGSADVDDHVYYLFPGKSGNDLYKTKYAYYGDWAGEKNRAEAVKLLSSAFTAETSGTVAYDLMEGMGLGAYSYPRLKALSHYGDWLAAFESGALAYYEVYSDGVNVSYGFLGANRSTLTDGGTAVGDGYGMVYHSQPTENVHYQYTLNGTSYEGVLYAGAAKQMDGGYWLMPLPSGLLNSYTTVGSSFYRQITVEGRSYWFNPHFSCQVIEGSDAPEAPTEIGIRTARHLYDLSLYYGGYCGLLTRDAVFQQGRAIDYDSYWWGTYGLNSTAPTSQQSIGSDSYSFIHTYDGGEYRITAVSIEGSGSYAGLFGLNRGTLRNIVLTTGGKSLSVSLNGSPRTAYIGALAGRNEGTVYNCAAAGWSVSGNANQGSTVYAGGFMGCNAGTVRACSVSSPAVTGTSTFAKLFIGGFTGGNSRTIQQSYAIADVEVHQIRGDGVTLGGFAGDNSGSIAASYCATALMSPGGNTYGFAPAAGSVRSCYYLNGGTYRFVDKVRLYNYRDQSGASAISDDALKKLGLTGFGAVSGANTYLHANTDTDSAAAYPYPGSVTGRGGSRVHYGDWVTRAELGTLGVLYWEYEEGGSNPGYHFSYIGFENGVRKEDRSLCTAHDDNDRITAYGYGFYYTAGTAKPDLSVTNMALGERYTAAEQALKDQMPQFDFVVYRTGSDGLHLTTGEAGDGYWTLQQDTLTLRYTVSPFFADAFSVTGTDDPGTKARPYQVRSVEQLQYINWSYINNTGSAQRDVTGSNRDYLYYPYLQHTSRTGQSEQTRADAEAGIEYYQSGQRWYSRTPTGTRPFRYWQQSHDLNGWNGAQNYDFQPIAGAVYNNTGSSYDMVLYNWFGSSYDGQSYYIKNVNIFSYCYNVGLFGTTAGAEIKNIVLYSDNGAVIQRSTDATPSSGATNVREYVTSYALGGLVGIAYDYNADMGRSTVTNCAIAGYTVADNSRNKQALGEAGIGGLIGVSSVNLNKCSAVVKLEVNCTHLDKSGYLRKAPWGNYVRVGGLVGGVRYTVTDCYTGGTITVDNALLQERVLYSSNNKSFTLGLEKSEQVKMTKDNSRSGDNPDTYVYIGGVGGSGFSANFANFTNSQEVVDGAPVYSNCYTYVTFPAMEGTITGISLIGSIADRAGAGKAALTINNCYYLDSSKQNIDFSRLPKYYGVQAPDNWWENSITKQSLYSLLGSSNSGLRNREAMLRGDLSYLKDYNWNSGSNSYSINGLTALSYEQMSVRENANISAQSGTYGNFVDALGSSFAWVTTEEDGMLVTGKYSFPGNKADLNGQDYPFPTVLTQENRFGTARLHYGEWPQEGLYWSRGILNVDMITDLQPDGTAAAELTLTFDRLNILSGTEVPELRFDKQLISAVIVGEPVRDTQKNTLRYTVRVTGLQEGPSELTAELGGYTARALVNVTAVLNITVSPTASIDQYVGESTTLTLSATDNNGNVLTGVKWSAVASGGSSVVSISEVRDQSFTVTGTGEGEDTPEIEAAYTAGSRTFKSTLHLSAVTRMQGVLGIAAKDDAGELSRWYGVLTKDLTGWDAGSFPQTAYTAAPGYTGAATLYLYSRGQAAELSNFEITGISVADGQGIYDALAATTTAYRAVPGDLVTNGRECYLPIVLRGAPLPNNDAESENTALIQPPQTETQTPPSEEEQAAAAEQGGQPPEVYTAQTDGETEAAGGMAGAPDEAAAPAAVTDEGVIRVTVTLRDKRSGIAYTLTLSYALPEKDTRVNITFRLGDKEIVKTAPFGGCAADCLPTAEELTAAGLPEGAQLTVTDEMRTPLYNDAVFEMAYTMGGAEETG